MEKLSKAAKERLLRSDFFHEVEEVVKAWDYYCKIGDIPKSKEMRHEWRMAKLALEFITGNIYDFSRDLNGNYRVVNTRDCNDILIVGRND